MKRFARWRGSGQDQAVASAYQRIAAPIIDARELGTLIDHDQARALCEPSRMLDECERALLFRLISLAHWSRAHGVVLP